MSSASGCDHNLWLPHAKKLGRECKYQRDWQNHGFSASKRGDNCNFCNCEINIAHGGVSNLKKQEQTMKHQELTKVGQSCKSLVTYMRQSPIEEAVTHAEVLFANFLAEHNLPFSLADHFTCLTPVMFPNSQIAKSYRSAHTKTICIVTGALHPHFSKPIILLCQSEPFSILCDEGNDNKDKNFAILVRIMEWVNQVTRFLHIPVCNIGTGEKLFEAIDESLIERDIPWSKVVGFESDTTNVMVGKHNSM